LIHAREALKLAIDGFILAIGAYILAREALKLVIDGFILVREAIKHAIDDYILAITKKKLVPEAKKLIDIANTFGCVYPNSIKRNRLPYSVSKYMNIIIYTLSKFSNNNLS